jgi:nucleoside-diphosphate-sugar epimerase
MPDRFTRKVLVAGASGLVGEAAVRRFAAEPDWDVVAVSRRRPRVPDHVTFEPVDLTDAVSVAALLGRTHGVTHVVYAAVHEVPGLAPGWTDEAAIGRNVAMLRNLIDPLLQASPNLRHVSLLQGTKAYGVHLPDAGGRRIPIPLRERDTHAGHRNFYFDQQRYLEDRLLYTPVALTVWRPTVVWGDAPGNNMNPLLPIAVYGALLRAEGRPLDFPGASSAPAVHEAVDADLLADALFWGATSPSAARRTFNVTNGDVFSWPDVWPAIAGALGMAVGEHRPVSLAEELSRRGTQWAELVSRYSLRADSDPVRFVGANSLVYADRLLRGAPGQTSVPILNSTIALRQAGFAGCIDTETMFVELLARLQHDRVIPPAA